MAVSPPRPPLPPLNPLRAFEAAARTGSFKDAADELHVTIGAVSQQVRILEDWAGVPLFERGSRGVTLTEDGSRVAADTSRAFDALGAVAARLRAANTAPPVRLATLPAIAQLWLPPRLGALREALGDRPISVTALEAPPNLLRESYDLSIFIRSDEVGEFILPDLIYPVCAPHLAQKIRTPEDLTNHTLLHDSSWDGDWARWAQVLNVDLTNVAEGPRYSLYALVLAEAKAGAGIAMGHSPLVRDALLEGSLVRPLKSAEAFAARGYKDGVGGPAKLTVELGPLFSHAERARISDVLDWRWTARPDQGRG